MMMLAGLCVLTTRVLVMVLFTGVCFLRRVLRAI